MIINKSIFYNKSFKKLLFTSLFVFFIVWIILFLIFSQFISGNIRAKAKQRNEIISVDVSRQLDSIASSVITLQKNVYQASWNSKLMSKAFPSSFDSYSRLSHCNELQSFITSTPAVRSIALLFPDQDIAVSNSAWTNVEDCINAFWINYKIDIGPIIKNITGPFPLDKVVELKQYYFINGYLITLQKLEMASASRGYAIYVIPTSEFLNPLSVYLKKEQESSFARMSLNHYDGQQYFPTLSEFSNEYNITHLNQELESVEKTSLFPGISYQFFFTKSFLKEDKMQYAAFVLLLVLFLLIGAALVFYLVSVMFVPLERLFCKLRNREGSEHISTVDGVEQAFDGMVEENLKMQILTQQYRVAAKNNLLLRIMQGYFVRNENLKSFLSTINEFELPFFADDYFRVFLITLPENPSEYSVGIPELISKTEKTLAKEDVRCAIAETNHHQIAIIIAFSSENIKNNAAEQAKSAVYRINDLLTADLGVQTVVGIGPLFEGLIGISKSYHQITEESSMKIKNAQSGIKQIYYPTDWKEQLNNSLANGDAEVAEKILNEIINENIRQTLSVEDSDILVKMLKNTIYQAAKENGVELSLLSKNIAKPSDSLDQNEKWQLIKKTSETLAHLIATQNQAQDNILMGQHLVEYVEQNYCNSEISLKMLSEKFNVSASAISRCFKRSTGVNFLEYLIKLRMELAKFMLTNKENSLHSIAIAVGYENDYSFRRAFERYEGTRLQDFRRENSLTQPNKI